jgi:putative membrane protein
MSEEPLIHAITGDAAEFRRLHPVAAVSNTLAFIRGNIVPLVILVFVGGRGDDPVSLPMILVGFGVVSAIGILRWIRFVYRAEPGRLQIRSGLAVRREATISRERIQVMDVVEGFFERIFGLVSLRIQTGSQEEAVVLKALTRQEARRLIELVHPEEAGAPHGAIGNGATRVDQPAQEQGMLLRPDAKSLWLAAATSGGIGVFFSILGTLYTQLDEFIDEERMLEALSAWEPQMGASIWASLFMLLLIISWLFSIAAFMLSHAGFEIRVKEGAMVLVRGLLERRRTTLPFGRIQAVRFVEGMFRQPLRRGAILVESIGVGNEQGSGSTAIHPLIHRNELTPWLAGVLPAFGFEEPAVRLRGRALAKGLAFYVTPILAVFSFAILTARPEGGMLIGMSMLSWLRRALIDSQVNLWIVMGVIAGVQGLMAWLRWRSAALGLLDDRILVRSRRIARQTSIVPSHRIQSMSVSQGPFQRLTSLCTLNVEVASGRRGLTLSIPDLQIEAAQEAEAWFRRRILEVRRPQ